MRTLLRIALGGAVAAWILLAVASPAHAEITQGSCSGSATLIDEDGDSVRIDGATTERVTIPREADVSPWTGDMGIEPPPDEVPHSGSISVEGPFGDVEVRSWEGETAKVSAEGSDHYDLGSIIPGAILGGTKMTVKGEEDYAGAVCKGRVDVEIEGSVANPASGAAAAGTAGTGYALYRVARRAVA